MKATRTVLRGHRAMRVGPLKPNAPARPPLVLLGGTAQWLDSWSGHITPLAQERHVLLYEVRGQAGATSTLDVADCSLSQQALDLAGVLDEAGLASSAVDICGFSFGGRVAMAAAAASRADGPLLPTLRRLCVTGVSADRGPRGRLALRSWRASLAADDLPGFVWRLILDTHSAKYLAANERSVQGWVNAVVQANSAAALRAVVEQTHTEDPEDPFHPLQMALRTRGRLEGGMLLAGAEDLLSPAGTAGALAEAAGWRFTELAGAAHATPIEQAVAWRKAVLGFVDAPE